VGEAAARAKGLLRSAEAIGYWLAGAPLLALLPAGLAYRGACWRADWSFRSWSEKRGQVVDSLRQVLGDPLGEPLGQQEAERLAREVFRIRSCEVVDLMRLRGSGRALGKLVEVRGREHLDAALAGGKGVILCGAHFGSYDSVFSVLHADGVPITSIGRWWWNYPPDGSSAVRRMWDYVFARRVHRHREQPNIEPWPGRMQVAVQAATALRGNGVVTICSEAPPLDAELNRTIEVPFLGRQARFLPGVVTLAKLTGAPVLMVFTHRLADYRHQVMEISAPVPMDGETLAAFERCTVAIEAAIRSHPAEWDFWFEPADLERLGLLRDTHAAASG
jgi:lauroyl/myristoyl acyltransferase